VPPRRVHPEERPQQADEDDDADEDDKRDSDGEYEAPEDIGAVPKEEEEDDDEQDDEEEPPVTKRKNKGRSDAIAVEQDDKIVVVLDDDENEAEVDAQDDVAEEDKLLPLEAAPVAGEAPTFVYAFANVAITSIVVPELTTREIVEEGVLNFVHSMTREGYDWGVGAIKVCALEALTYTLIDGAHRLEAIRRLNESGVAGFGFKDVAVQLVSRTDKRRLSPSDVLTLGARANAVNLVHNPTSQSQHLHWMGNMVSAMQTQMDSTADAKHAAAVTAAEEAGNVVPVRPPRELLRIATANVTGIVTQIEKNGATPVGKSGKPLATESLKRLCKIALFGMAAPKSFRRIVYLLEASERPATPSDEDDDDDEGAAAKSSAKRHPRRSKGKSRARRKVGSKAISVESVSSAGFLQPTAVKEADPDGYATVLLSIGWDYTGQMRDDKVVRLKGGDDNSFFTSLGFFVRVALRAGRKAIAIAKQAADQAGAEVGTAEAVAAAGKARSPGAAVLEADARPFDIFHLCRPRCNKSVLDELRDLFMSYEPPPIAGRKKIPPHHDSHVVAHLAEWSDAMTLFVTPPTAAEVKAAADKAAAEKAAADEAAAARAKKVADAKTAAAAKKKEAADKAAEDEAARVKAAEQKAAADDSAKDKAAADKAAADKAASDKLAEETSVGGKAASDKAAEDKVAADKAAAAKLAEEASAGGTAAADKVPSQADKRAADAAAAGLISDSEDVPDPEATASAAPSDSGAVAASTADVAVGEKRGVPLDVSAAADASERSPKRRRTERASPVVEPRGNTASAGSHGSRRGAALRAMAAIGASAAADAQGDHVDGAPDAVDAGQAADMEGLAVVFPHTPEPYEDIVPPLVEGLAHAASIARGCWSTTTAPAFSTLIPAEHQAWDLLAPRAWFTASCDVDSYFAATGRVSSAAVELDATWSSRGRVSPSPVGAVGGRVEVDDDDMFSLLDPAAGALNLAVGGLSPSLPANRAEADFGALRSAVVLHERGWVVLSHALASPSIATDVDAVMVHALSLFPGEDGIAAGRRDVWSPIHNEDNWRTDGKALASGQGRLTLLPKHVCSSEVEAVQSAYVTKLRTDVVLAAFAHAVISRVGAREEGGQLCVRVPKTGSRLLLTTSAPSPQLPHVDSNPRHVPTVSVGQGAGVGADGPGGDALLPLTQVPEHFRQGRPASSTEPAPTTPPAGAPPTSSGSAGASASAPTGPTTALSEYTTAPAYNYFVMATGADGSWLRVWPGSVHVLRHLLAGHPDESAISPQLVFIPPYSVVIVRGDFVHAGAGAADNAARLAARTHEMRGGAADNVADGSAPPFHYSHCIRLHMYVQDKDIPLDNAIHLALPRTVFRH